MGAVKSPFEGGLRGMSSGNHTPLAPLEEGIALRKIWHTLKLTGMRLRGNDDKDIYSGFLDTL
jgi:hypothetical protein